MVPPIAELGPPAGAAEQRHAWLSPDRLTRVRAIILDVRKMVQRVKIILSRTNPDFVPRLFEMEIPWTSFTWVTIRIQVRGVWCYAAE